MGRRPGNRVDSGGMNRTLPAKLPTRREDAIKWLRKEDDRLSLWCRLPNDLLAEQTMMLIEKIDDEGDPSLRSALALQVAITKAPPRLYQTYDLVREFLKKRDPDFAAFEGALGALRETAMKERFSLESKAREPEKQFEDWIWHVFEE